MSSVPGNANVDVWFVTAVLAVTAATLAGLEWRARRNAPARDGNGATPPDGEDLPPTSHADGEI